MTKYNPDDVIRLFHSPEGLTLQQIGDALGITRERVRQILAGEGLFSEGRLNAEARMRRQRARDRYRAIAWKRKLRRFARCVRQCVATQLYLGGVSYTEMSNICGLAPQNICTILRNTNAPRRTRGFGRPRLNDEVREVIARRYLAGESARNLADEFGLAAGYVWQLAHKKFPNWKRAASTDAVHA